MRHSVLKQVLACLCAVSSLSFSVQCAKKPSVEEEAMVAAQKSYELLLQGDYQGFLAGCADIDSLPASYREELLASYKQFVAQQKDANGGIKGVTASRAVIDSSLQVVQVFLMMEYADLKEEIVVPMVERNGQWKMK